MKKVVVLGTLVGSLLINGCSMKEDFKIESEEFTEEQYEMLALTGNRAFKYELENLPQDKTFDINIVYEVYEGKEKVKEENVMGMGYGPTEEKLEDIEIAMNIQDNKLRLMSGGAYSSIDIEEDISKLSNYYYTGEQKIDIGDEIYLFHAFKGEGEISNENLASLSREEIDKLIEENELNVFIKVVLESK